MIEFEKKTALPVYKQIAEHLKQDIVSGKIKQGEQLPTEHELSTKFESSRLTVRRGLKILEDQHYISQFRGRGTFVTYQNNAVSVRKIAIWGELSADDNYWFSLFKGIQESLQERVDNQIIFLPKNGNDIFGKTMDSQADGLIVIAPNPEEIKAICEKSFDNFPLVVINTSGGKLKKCGRVCINSDNETAVYKAVEYLRELGHKRVAFIAIESYSENMITREKAYKKALSLYGMDMDKSLQRIFKRGPLWYEESRKIARELMSLSKPPTAVFCPGRSFAYGAWQGIMDCKLKIPEDVSILGLGCEYMVNPGFSTLLQPLVEMGRKAGDCLLAQIFHAASKNSEFIFDIDLIDRGSCREI